MAKKKKTNSVGSLSKLKVSTLRAKATRKGVKNVSKKTKAQLIKSLKPTKIGCSVAGHNMHSKTRKKRTTAASRLPKC